MKNMQYTHLIPITIINEILFYVNLVISKTIRTYTNDIEQQRGNVRAVENYDGMTWV